MALGEHSFIFFFFIVFILRLLFSLQLHILYQKPSSGLFFRFVSFSCLVILSLVVQRRQGTGVGEADMGIIIIIISS